MTENRIAKACAACTIMRRGIKPRLMPAHTCERANPKYVEPEHSRFGVKVCYSERVKSTRDASLYKLTAQWLNGYRVKRGTELWVFQNKHVEFETVHQTQRPERWFWLSHEIYNTLAFV